MVGLELQNVDAFGAGPSSALIGVPAGSWTMTTTKRLGRGTGVQCLDSRFASSRQLDHKNITFVRVALCLSLPKLNVASAKYLPDAV